MGTFEDMACRNCSEGYFAQAEGSEKCFPCPAGSRCNETGLSLYVPCPAGKYNSYSGNNVCLNCTTGTYQPSEGSAICEPCIQGKYLNIEGATERSLCQNCPIGKYSNTQGLSECLQCPYGQYQDALGATICKSCKELGKIMISNVDFTGCENDPLLKSKQIYEVIFSKGVALSVSFSVSAAFVFVCGFMQLKREAAQDHIGQISRSQVFLLSALSGFKFGSELFLIFGIWRETQAIAGIMLVGRLLHPLLLIYILCVMFLSENMKDMLTSCVPQAKLWGSHLHMDYTREVLPVLPPVIFVCMSDITLVQMLPWKRSEFYTKSKGFPSASLMQLCLGLKTMQSAVSVVCQVSYLVSNSNLHDPTASPQAKALFGLNIAMSITAVIIGVMMFLLKGSLVRSGNDKDVAENNKAEIEISNQMAYIGNPLQNMSDEKDAITNVATHSHVYELEMENADLKTMNTDLKTEITILQQKIKELERKDEDS